MNILHLSDLHLRPEGMKAYGIVDSYATAKRACDAIANLAVRVDAVIITGDLADCGFAEEYQRLNGILAHLAPLPVFVIPGNHDRREEMLAHLPGLRHNEGFIQYCIEDFPVRLVLLDSVIASETHGTLCPARLAWLERTLAAQPERETMIALHHPPFLTGVRQFDDINLRNYEEFRSLIARHKQVTRIISGHHHRMIVGNVAQAICFVAPSVAYQFMLTHDAGIEMGFNLEPPAFLLHSWVRGQGFATQSAFVEPFPGPFPILLGEDYPGCVVS
jgi:3',5'-cyclic-AMP phosphodiesterase